MLSRQSSFILEKSVISSSSSFLSFSYLQYVHQSSSNESGLIRWAVHSDLISGILSKISVNQNVTRSSSNYFLLEQCAIAQKTEDAQNHQKNKEKTDPNEQLCSIVLSSKLLISFQIITEILYATEVFSFLEKSVYFVNWLFLLHLKTQHEVQR